MMPLCRTGRPRRPAFTLIELLVVIALLAIITAMGVLLIPNLNDQQRAPRGAGQVQQALQLAKTRAMRNRSAAGVRLTLDSNQQYCTQLQLIEQPDDFIVQPGVTAGQSFRRISTGVNAQNTVVLEPTAASGAPDFSGGFAGAGLWPVQAGDYLEVNGGLPHLITAVTNTQITLASPLPAPLNLVSNYRVIRAPRLSADDPILLPDEIAIDAQLSSFDQGTTALSTQVNNNPGGLNTNAIDILFTPSGSVVNPAAANDAIYLFVRDTTLAANQGDPTLIVIYTRSGAVAAYPVNITPSADPYSFAKTGRSSGM